MEMNDRLMSGRFKVFSNMEDWFKEYRSYHRKDGKLVDKNDDLLKATFYGLMMKRYAAREVPAHLNRPSMAIVKSRI